jgi:glycogen synthase
MNILVISNLYPPHTVGGYEVACAAFTQEFTHDKVTILTTSYGFIGPTIDGDVLRVLPNVIGTWPHGETHLPRGWRRFFTPEMFRLVLEWIRKVKPDVCYMWNLGGLSLAPVVSARVASVPVAYHLEDNWMPDMAFHPLKQIEWAKRVLGAPPVFHGRTGAIFVSDFLRRSYSSQGFIFPRSAVIHNGIREPDVIEGHLARSESTPIRLLFAGRIVLEKGIEVLLDGMRLAQHRAPGSFSLSIAGSGPTSYVEELQRRSSDNSAYVHWLGRLDRRGLAREYASHDITVVPSTWEEPFGLVAIEAMAAGLPVIATRSGGLPEIVRSGGNGYIVPPNDAQALCEAFMLFVNDPELAKRLGRQALTDVRARFDMGTVASQARAFLEELVAS